MRSHPRVLIYNMFRFRLLVDEDWHSGAQSNQLRRELVEWIDACDAEHAEHVIYVSTASADLFRHANIVGTDSPIESLHFDMEQRLRAASGIKQWTILRPVTSCHCVFRRMSRMAA